MDFWLGQLLSVLRSRCCRRIHFIVIKGRNGKIIVYIQDPFSENVIVNTKTSLTVLNSLESEK
jgi:hypothetical protein